MGLRLISPRWLGLILGVSLAARIGLALQGGQLFFGDETRYLRGVDLHQALLRGDVAGITEVLKWPEHLAFNFINAAVAPLHHALAFLAGRGDWSQPENIYLSLQFAAVVLGLFSVLNIWLVHRIARAAGAGEGEALWATLLMAASNTLFFQARHLQPYDCALTAFLAGILLGQARGSPGRCLGGGALAALTFEIYNGYWFLVPLLLGSLWLAPSSWPERIRATGWWSLGFLGALIVLMLPGVVLGGDHFWLTLVMFSGSARQGLFAEGWSLPFEFLWHAEGWAGGVLVAGLLLAVTTAFRTGVAAPRLRRWLVLLALAWLLPAFFSVVLEKFVVYGRTVRPLIPFACLAAGWSLHCLASARPRLAPFMAALVLAMAVANFAPHYLRIFPRDVEMQVLGQYGMVKRWLSFSGCIYQPLLLPGARPGLALANAQNLYPVRDYLGYPEGTALFSVAHPLAYLPYQYEGHTPRERALLRAHPPAIKLIRLADPAAVPYHPPAHLLFTEADRADGHDRRGD